MRVLEDGDLETQGLLDYNSNLAHPFTAHPKLDPVTGNISNMKRQKFVWIILGYRLLSIRVEAYENFVRVVFTGELFAFGYDVNKAPHVTYRVVSKDGVLSEPVHITIPEPVMMHDFAITENFAIFMDLPLVFRPKVVNPHSLCLLTLLIRAVFLSKVGDWRLRTFNYLRTRKFSMVAGWKSACSHVSLYRKL